MTDDQTILKMIETVDPNDTVKLQEINKAVELYLGWEHYDMVYQGKPYVACKSNEGGIARPVREFCNSRDALKKIRPEGYTLRMGIYMENDEGELVYSFCSFNRNFNKVAETKCLPTEELAELHAIIQAIEWERNNG